MNNLAYKGKTRKSTTSMNDISCWSKSSVKQNIYKRECNVQSTGTTASQIKKHPGVWHRHWLDASTWEHKLTNDYNDNNSNDSPQDNHHLSEWKHQTKLNKKHLKKWEHELTKLFCWTSFLWRLQGGLFTVYFFFWWNSRNGQVNVKSLHFFLKAKIQDLGLVKHQVFEEDC